MISKLAIKPCGHHLRSGALGASDDGDDSCQGVKSHLMTLRNRSLPIVTMTLKRPLTILSTTRSSSASLVVALFRAQ